MQWSFLIAQTLGGLLCGALGLVFIWYTHPSDPLWAVVYGGLIGIASACLGMAAGACCWFKRTYGAWW